MTQEILKTSLSLPKELMKKARIKAITQGTNVSAVIRAFLEKWVADCPAEDEAGQEGESAE